MPYIIGGGFLVLIIGIYILFYTLNGKTPVPEGCEFPDDYSGCSSCSSAGCVSRVESKKVVK